jgi:IgGFc binding protein
MRTAILAGLALLGAACAAAEKAPGADEAPAHGGAGGNGGTGGLAIGGQDPSCEPRCSADLHHVLCGDDIIVDCAADQGCGPDVTCVPACEAAAAHKSTVGCELYSRRFIGGCYAVYVANTWNAAVTLAVEIDGVSYDVSDFARRPVGHGIALGYEPLPGGLLAPNDVAMLFLDGAQCPVGQPPLPPFAGDHAYRIVSSAPVVAYDIEPYQGGSSAITSASLLLPVSAWDTNYVVVEPWPYGENTTPPKLSVIAASDDTEVTLSPIVDVPEVLVAGVPMIGTGLGVPKTYLLDRGEILEVAQAAELTGSVVASNKPVGVTGSSNCFQIDDCCCDSAHQQIPPVHALGSEYVAVRHGDRGGMAENPPWRLVGAVDGTALTYEPVTPFGAPTALGRGQAVTFRTAEPFVVRSQDADHPFYLAGYMTAGADHLGLGDPEFVNVVPAAQYPSSYVFFTDPTYPITSLVVVRSREPGGLFADVTLACAGVLGGWQPIGASDYEYTRVKLTDGFFEPQGSCDNGRQEMTSAAPFGVTVWGWGTLKQNGDPYADYVSYAYPAGAVVQPINDVEVPVIR